MHENAVAWKEFETTTAAFEISETNSNGPALLIFRFAQEFLRRSLIAIIGNPVTLEHSLTKSLTLSSLIKS